jgi:hypothetical protein
MGNGCNMDACMSFVWGHGPPRPKMPKTLREAVFAKTGGLCHHCGATLTNVRGGWHVDHFPVPFRDLESQVCCGVTDPLDVQNLVPACTRCNLSHEHESRAWCGRAQIPCRRQWCLTLAAAVVMGTVFVAGLGIQRAARVL